MPDTPKPQAVLPPTQKNEATVQKLREILGVWNFTASWMVRFTTLFGMATIVCSVLVSVYTATDCMSDRTIKVLASISTASLALLTAFNVVQKGNNARQAWRILNAAIYKFETGIYTMKELIHDYEIGEKIVGDVDFSYGVASKPDAKPGAKKRPTRTPHIKGRSGLFKRR